MRGEAKSMKRVVERMESEAKSRKDELMVIWL
jgi:uncharacterized alpha/beta hydrolase family protein